MAFYETNQQNFRKLGNDDNLYYHFILPDSSEVIMKYFLVFSSMLAWAVVSFLLGGMFGFFVAINNANAGEVTIDCKVHPLPCLVIAGEIAKLGIFVSPEAYLMIGEKSNEDFERSNAGTYCQRPETISGK